MEQIKILFYILSTFFGIEDGRIAADKTIITIHPETHQIVINQEGLFTIIRSERDSIMVMEQWDRITNQAGEAPVFAKELDSFPVKNFTIITEKSDICPQLKFSYTDEKDLEALGIWYNEDKNEFSINHIPQENIKTQNGKLADIYWVFDGNKSFSFTIEPFSQMPENYKNTKYFIKDLLSNEKKD